MRAEYDSRANALAIELVPVDDVTSRRTATRSTSGYVAIVRGEPVDVEVLYPDLGLEEPLRLAAEKYGLDPQGLLAAARSALAAPDRSVRRSAPASNGSASSFEQLRRE